VKTCFKAFTIDSVVHTFNLSPRQKPFLLGARRGEGLFATKMWTQMQVLASPMEAEIANTTLVTTTLVTLAQLQQQKEFIEQELQKTVELNKQLEGDAMAITRAVRDGIVVDSPVPRPM